MPSSDLPATGVSRFAAALAEACVLAAVVVTPLYFNPETQRVFEPDKLAWVFLLGIGALWAYLLLSVEEGRAAWHRPSGLVLGMTLVAAVLVVSSLPFQAVVPVTSLFGSYYRGRGLLAQLALLVLGMAAARIMQRPEPRRRLFDALLAPVAPVALYAIFQRLHIDFIQWDIYGQGATVRAFGPLGNSLILGAYLMMTLPLLAARFVAAGEDPDGRAPSGRRAGARRAVYGVFGLLALAGLLASQSRGPFMGLLAGLGLLAVLWTALAGQRRLTVLLVLGAAAGLLALGLVGRTAASPLGRLGTILSSDSRTAQERRLVWEALERVAQNSRPPQLLLGYGPDSLMYVLPPAVTPELVRLTPEQIFDRAHNNLWEWWVSAGLLGVGAFLMVFALALTTGFRLLGLVGSRRETMGLWAAMLAGGSLLAAVPAMAKVKELAAVGLPAGLVAGAAGYAAVWGWWHAGGQDVAGRGTRHDDEHEGAAFAPPGLRWLVGGLVATVVACLVEGSVGIPSAAEDLVYWVAVGALAGLGAMHPAHRQLQGSGGRNELATAPPASPSDSSPVVDEAAAARQAGHDGEAVLDGLVLSCVLFAPLLHPQAGAGGLSTAKNLLWLLLPAALVGSWSLRLAGRATAVTTAALRKGRRPSEVASGPRLPWRRMLAITAVVVVLSRFGYFVLGTFTGGGAVSFALLIVGSVVAMATLWSEERRVTAPTEYWRWVPYASLGLLATLAIWRLALAPIVADTLLRDGLVAAAATKFDQARTSFDQALALWPNEPLYATFVAGAYRERFVDPNASKDEQDAAFEKAESVLQRSLQLAPSDQLYQRLATLYRDKGDKAADSVERIQSWQQAQEQYLNAIDFAPNRPDTLAELGALFERTGAISETVRAYRQAYDLNPARRDAAAGLMRVALAQGQVTEAVRWLDALLATNEGQPQLVEDAIKAGEDLPAGSLLAKQSEVLFLARQGKAAEAKQLLDQVMRENEDAPANLPLAAWLTKEMQGANQK